MRSCRIPPDEVTGCCARLCLSIVGDHHEQLLRADQTDSAQDGDRHTDPHVDKAVQIGGSGIQSGAAPRPARSSRHGSPPPPESAAWDIEELGSAR